MSTVLGMARRGLFSDEHEGLRDSVRTHIERAVVPAREEWAAARSIPRGELRTATEHGFVGNAIPEQHGGMGLDDVRFPVVVVEEAVDAGLSALALVLVGHGETPVHALNGSTAPHVGEWLRGLATVEIRAASALHTSLRVDRRGVLDGRAGAVVGASDADLLLVVAEGVDGAAAVAVERDAAGVRVVPKQDPIGLAAAGIADVSCSGAHGCLLSDVDVEDLRAGEWLLVAVAAIAGARAALSLTADYTRDRRAFGTPIAAFPNSQQLLGEAAADIAAAAALVNRCVETRVAGRLPAVAAATAKLHAAEVLGRVVDAGVQLHGGYGYMLEYPISHAFADARFLRLHGGTTQELRALVAGEVLRT